MRNETRSQWAILKKKKVMSCLWYSAVFNCVIVFEILICKKKVRA